MDDSSGMTASHSPPPHPEDPVQENPFSIQDPRHRVWAKATRTALIDLHALKQRHFEKPSIVDRPLGQTILENFYRLREFSAQTRAQQQSHLIEFIFVRFQIWAKRALSVVRSDQDARDYEQWLKSYMQAGLMLWTENCPGHFDAESFLAVLRKRLLQAYEYWSGNALKQVAEVEDQSEKEMASDQDESAHQRPGKHETGPPQEQVQGASRQPVSKPSKAALADSETRERRRDILKRYRVAKSLSTMADLARRLGVSKSSIEGIVRGDRTRYSEETRLSFLKTIGVPPEEW